MLPLYKKPVHNKFIPFLHLLNLNGIAPKISSNLSTDKKTDGRADSNRNEEFTLK